MNMKKTYKGTLIANESVTEWKARKAIEAGRREDLIHWLQQNDTNGCYNDEDNLLEFGEVCPTDELERMYREQSEDAK